MITPAMPLGLTLLGCLACVGAADLPNLGPEYFTRIYGDGAPSWLSISDVDVVDLTQLSWWWRYGPPSLDKQPYDKQCSEGSSFPVNSFFRPRCQWMVKRSFAEHQPARDGEWVEITHGATAYHTGHPTATWLYLARGSGIYVNVGKTVVYRDHDDAVLGLLNRTLARHNPVEWEAKPYFHWMFWAAAQAGYNSVQFTGHCDQPCGCDAIEIVIVGVDAEKAVSACPVPFRSGYNASRPCNCISEGQQFSNCGVAISEYCSHDIGPAPAPAPSPPPPSLDDSLKAEVQSLIDGVSDSTGFGIGIGLVDDRGHDFGVGSGPRTPSDLPSKAAPGSLTGHDTYVLGSGTQPYVSVCILRLAEQGKLSLNDPAAAHLDKPMIAMWNTTLGDLFGSRAGSITVGDLIFMRSGLSDLDNPSHGDDMLKSPTVWSPIRDLQFLASRSWPWACAPGTCISYSSANYLLAGLVLVAHSGRAPFWQSFDILPLLGPDFQKAQIRHTRFPTVGPLSIRGLTTAGRALRRSGLVEVYTQDASIMGFCYGNMVASPRDVAKFFFDLLAGGAFISEKSRATMQKWHLLDTGGAKGRQQYGAGLEMNSCARPDWDRPPRLTDLGTYIGHEGVTFGFRSNQGLFPALNTSIAVMTNQDRDWMVNYAITCRILKIVAKYRNTKELVAKYRNIRCPSLPYLVVFV